MQQLRIAVRLTVFTLLAGIASLHAQTAAVQSPALAAAVLAAPPAVNQTRHSSSAVAPTQAASDAQTSAAKGTPPVRKGFFVGGGFGYGSAGIDCNGCSTDRESGPVAYIRLGGTINPHLRIGVESNGWAKTEFGVDEQIGFLTADLYVYPSVSNNFWIKGGVGFAEGKESNDFDEAKADGVGIAAGIGYDWNVGGGNFVFVPFATYLRQVSGKIKFDGEDTGVSANTDVFEIGLGLGFRH